MAAGQRIAVTAHGRVVAELVPPGTAARKSPESRWDELIAAGILHPPVETGDPFEDWPDIRLPRGTAAELIDADRGEAWCYTTPLRPSETGARRRARPPNVRGALLHPRG